LDPAKPRTPDTTTPTALAEFARTTLVPAISARTWATSVSVATAGSSLRSSLACSHRHCRISTRGLVGFDKARMDAQRYAGSRCHKSKRGAVSLLAG
jgi:hypothetical protein